MMKLQWQYDWPKEPHMGVSDQKNTWMQTYSGIQFWPLEPRAEDVRLEDIAHGLALQCRFNGHCREFYSIAQHSVLVADAMRDRHRYIAMPNGRYRAALLHDAAEAYLGDIITPIKGDWPGYRLLELTLLDVIHDALRVPRNFIGTTLVKHCDGELLATEVRDLMGSPPAEWEKLPPPLSGRIEPVPPDEAERMWLEAWATNNY